MKLEYLREFLDLSETLNYSLSANRLYISQPTLSRHIQIMEKELGFGLVSTSSHGISLTKMGELAIPSFRKILREYDRFLHQTNHLVAQVSGKLCIGILYYAMDEYFSDFFNFLRDKYPNVEFVIYMYQPQALRDDLGKGKIDVGSMSFYNLKKHADLRLQVIGHQKTLVMMREDHPLSQTEQLTLEELMFSDLIELKNDTYSNEVTRELLEMKHLHFPNVHYTDNIETVPMMIRKTGGIHLTGESCKKQNASGLVYKVVEQTGTMGNFCLAALPSNDNPLIDILYQEAKEYFKKN